MTSTLILRSPPVFVRATLYVVAIAGCIHETHVVGEDRADAMAEVSPDATGDTGGSMGSAMMPDGGSADVMPVVPLGGASTGGWLIAISPEEVARRLSQFMFRRPPTAALTAAIIASAPRTNEDVGSLTDGLLLDDASLAGRQAFYRWWLRLDAFAAADRDAALFPAFTDDVRSALVAQSLMFAEDVTWRPQGDLATLLTEPAAFVTEATAPWFSNVSVPPGAPATRVMLDGTQYAGIVTQPAVVAAMDYRDRAEPSARGLQLLERYLCGWAPVEPNKPALLPVPAGLTIRQWMEQGVDSLPQCGGCHFLFDPPGFAFGHFDAVGAFHEKEGGLPVDTSGTVSSVWWRRTTKEAASFTGIVDLAKQLAPLPEVAECFAKKWLGFSTGKYANVLADELSLSEATLIDDTDYVVKRATIQGGLNLRGTIRAVTETHIFLDP